jgi:hypothetical protein
MYDDRLAQYLAYQEHLGDGHFHLDDPQFIRILLSRWARLAPDDPKNVKLDDAASILNLIEQQESLASAGIEDLRGLAQAVIAAPQIEKLNAEIMEIKEQLPEAEAAELDLFDSPITVEDAAAIEDAIGGTLVGKRGTTD